jgi:cyclic beta-1,2-glucan synthetase
VTEWLLGLCVQGGTLRIAPCIPRAWPGFSVQLRRGATHWRIRVDNPAHVCRGVAELFEDGTRRDGNIVITLRNDGKTHEIRAVLG